MDILPTESTAVVKKLTFPDNPMFGMLFLEGEITSRVIHFDDGSYQEIFDCLPNLGEARRDVEYPARYSLGIKLFNRAEARLEQLSPYDFEIIDLRSIFQLTGQDLAKLELLPTVKALYLPKFTDDSLLAALAKTTWLKRLTLEDALITDEGLALLGNLGELEELSLSGTNVTGSFLNYLSKLTKLKKLNLNRTKINDGCLAYLSNFTALEELNLSETSVSNSGLADLRAIPSLLRVNLNSTLTDEQLQCQTDPKLLLPPEELASELVRYQKLFAARFLSILSQSNAGENVIASPLSFFLALHLLSNGASGDSLAALKQCLGPVLGNPEGAELAAAVCRELSNLNQHVELWIANSLWVNKELVIKPGFVESAMRKYGCLVANIDPLASTSVSTINSWVSSQTKGLIPNVVSKIDSDFLLILINAVYFKGLWSEPFKAERTEDWIFNFASGATKICQFMHQDNVFRHLKTDCFEAAVLPYKGGRANMYLFLPHEDSSTAKVVSYLEMHFEQVFAQFEEMTGLVALPRFEMASSHGLNTVLEQLGLGGLLVSGVAEFQNLTETGDCYISEAIQKAFIKVDEKGTEAAAVTAIMMMCGSLAPTKVETFELILDRPFVFVIQDDISGMVLFYGIVEEPIWNS
jgi:serine protease inhibitor